MEIWPPEAGCRLVKAEMKDDNDNDNDDDEDDDDKDNEASGVRGELKR